MPKGVVGQFQHRPHNRPMTMLLVPKILVIVIGAWFVLDSRRGDVHTVRQRRWHLARGIFLMALGFFLLVAKG